MTITTIQQTRIQLKLQRDTGSIFYQDRDDNVTFHIEPLRTTDTTTTKTSITTTTRQSCATITADNNKMKPTSSSLFPHYLSSQASSTSATNSSSLSDSENDLQPETRATSVNGDGEHHDQHHTGLSEEELAEELEATNDLVRSFLRQHLLKNGERSRGMIPLMRKDGVEALLIATVVLHLRRDGRREIGAGGDAGEASGQGYVVRDDGAAVRSLHQTLGSLVAVLQQREKVLSYLEGNPHVGAEAEPVSE
jgi:hypothetical protein